MVVIEYFVNIKCLISKNDYDSIFFWLFFLLLCTDLGELNTMK